MKDNGECYEYVCYYVDDLIAMLWDLRAFFGALEKAGFGLKGVTDTPDVFLGGSIRRDPNGTLRWGAKCYISQFERIVGSKPVTPVTSPNQRWIQHLKWIKIYKRSTSPSLAFFSGLSHWYV
jgi:hypothetical protein